MHYSAGTKEQIKEVYSLKELEKAFSTEGVQKGGARFDYEKAKWVNQQQLQRYEFRRGNLLAKPGKRTIVSI